MDLDSRVQYKLIFIGYSDKNFKEYRILEALYPLGEWYNHKTSEMWCFYICDSFRKILEENPRILSKNGYITMYGKLYESNKVNTLLTNYIYCSVCDSLVFVSKNYYNARFYYDSYLKRCISENTISNEHVKRKEILQSIDRREFNI